MKTAPDPVHIAIEYTMREDRGRIIAALTHALGDFELAEECLSEATETALRVWARKGVPKSRRGWLLQVARRRAIDRMRRAKTLRVKAQQIAVLEQAERDSPADSHDIPDHRLRLIFTCCHPAIEEKTRIALTLRTLGGLTTDEVARAFLDKPTAMGQRLARARAKISKAGIPFVIPDAEELPERIASVLSVIYFIFNEGYAATEGAEQIRADLCEEAIYLARLMVGFCPDNAEARGLLALILLSHARRNARAQAGGYVPLLQQDRNLWEGRLITEGKSVLEAALKMGNIGANQLQASISALHCEASSAEQTDWPQIVALYRLLVQIRPSAVVRLNLAVALSFRCGPEQGLQELESLSDALASYQPYHAARADFLARLGRGNVAQQAYEVAIELTQIESEKNWLRKQKQAVCKE